MALPWDEIITPNKVRQLQRTLYRKAKANGRWRAWSLYGDLCRRDVLATALAAVVSNAGSAGVDGVTTEQVKTDSVGFLDVLESELRSKSYPGQVRYSGSGSPKRTANKGRWASRR
jgi:RNA-directed DNA polymerase